MSVLRPLLSAWLCALCLCGVTSAHAASTVELLSLTCDKTSERKTDEVYFSITVDGRAVRLPASGTMDMKKRRTKTLGQTYTVNTLLHIVAKEYDKRSKDDVLGIIAMSAAPKAGVQTARLQMGGGNYRLKYRITAIAKAKPKPTHAGDPNWDTTFAALQRNPGLRITQGRGLAAQRGETIDAIYKGTLEACMTRCVAEPACRAIDAHRSGQQLCVLHRRTGTDWPEKFKPIADAVHIELLDRAGTAANTPTKAQQAHLHAEKNLVALFEVATGHAIPADPAAKWTVYRTVNAPNLVSCGNACAGDRRCLAADYLRTRCRMTDTGAASELSAAAKVRSPSVLLIHKPRQAAYRAKLAESAAFNTNAFERARWQDPLYGHHAKQLSATFTARPHTVLEGPARGKKLDVIRGKSVTQCSVACICNASCRSFAYQPKTATCTLASVDGRDQTLTNRGGASDHFEFVDPKNVPNWTASRCAEVLKQP
jgi:hypothetical protein